MKALNKTFRLGLLGALLSFAIPSQAASVDRALDRVGDACRISYHTKKVIRYNVKHDSAKLIGNVQSFLHRDGRLILIDLDNHCNVEQLRIDEGAVTTTKAIGKRLFMVVKNKYNGKGRLYMVKAFNSSRTPYRVYEVKYNSKASYARAHKLKVINKKGMSPRLQIIKEDGSKYKRLEEPQSWGHYNSASHVRSRIEELPVRDERTYSYSHTVKTGKRQIVILATPVCAEISLRLEYLFGYVTEEISVSACY